MLYSKSTNGFYAESIHGDAIPEDAVEITEQEWRDLLDGQSERKRIVADADGFPTLQDPPPPTQAEIIAQYESALDAHLDAVAQSYRYDDRKSFALRAGYAGPYQAEAIAFAQWMDDCNVQAFARMSRVLAGLEPLPTIEALIADLPALILPA